MSDKIPLFNELRLFFFMSDKIPLFNELRLFFFSPSPQVRAGVHGVDTAVIISMQVRRWADGRMLVCVQPFSTTHISRAALPAPERRRETDRV